LEEILTHNILSKKLVWSFLFERWRWWWPVGPHWKYSSLLTNYSCC